MQLNNANLELISQTAHTPEYDRSQVTCGIMHMSIGGFHRSHQAVYVDNVLAKGHSNWGICAIGLMPQDKDNIEKLQQQDNLYTVLERSAEADTARIVGSIIETMHAPSSPEAVLNRLADDNIKILSLTVTEKGYCFDSNQDLDQSNAFIQEDLANLSVPKTALGYIVSALKNRKDQSQSPFTVMSCDNLPGNGHLTQKLVLQFAELVDPELATWIQENVSFPNSMVDRITPVTTNEIVETIKAKFQIEDAWPVVCEDYIQWILEDNFCNGKPPFEEAGVQVIVDVDPYEKMKVRLLNGSHSALAYLSYLKGYRNVDKAMADPLIKNFVRSYMDQDITPTIPEVPGINLDEYKDKLIERFANPAISDQVQRLAEDGSQKIPISILPCIASQLENGGSTKFATLALAGWFRYLTAVDEELKPIEIKDPLSEKLIASAKLDTKTPLHLLGITEIFGTHLPLNDNFVKDLASSMNQIKQDGVEKSLEEALN
ncbi:MAG: mannitol dehydrogenase [Micavibrio sp.]|nr:mannitol dehydrogenase [Micavibrio sp.]|tara:strand:- start:1067 stop:2530 length:1464 start_codon:yes stop_codon:yes gene_type:complete